MANQKLELHRALLSAFPSRGKFAMLLGQRFDVDYDVLTPQDTLDVEYWTVVEQVAAEGWMTDLSRAAFEAVPRNELMANLAVKLGITALHGIAVPGAGAVVASAPVLERMVRDRSDLVDLPGFLAQLSALEGQTCRIESVTGARLKPIGTGFLVGPDLVLTNHHVIEPMLTGGSTAQCRFDYLTDAAGIEVRRGVEAPLAADWHVISRPHDCADVSLDDTALPAPDNLDFALMRLATPVGDTARQGDLGPDNPARGWIAIDPLLTAVQGDDLFILQHPLGAPLKLGIGRVTKDKGQGLRLQHDVTTEPGSSGSPVFNRHLSLVALHHVGDPNSFRNAAFNQAVPMARIVSYLAGKVAPFWEARP